MPRCCGLDLPIVVANIVSGFTSLHTAFKDAEIYMSTEDLAAFVLAVLSVLSCVLPFHFLFHLVETVAIKLTVSRTERWWYGMVLAPSSNAFLREGVGLLLESWPSLATLPVEWNGDGMARAWLLPSSFVKVFSPRVMGLSVSVFIFQWVP